MRFPSILQWLSLVRGGFTQEAEDVELRHSIKRQSSFPSSDRFLRRGEMAIASVDDYLYVAGGQISQYLSDGDTDFNRGFVNLTLALPLDESWEVEDVEYVTTHNHPNYQQVSGHSIVAGRSGGRDRLWSWGGRSDKREARLYVFAPNGKGGGAWSNEAVTDSIIRGDFGAATACGGSMIYFGGRARRTTDDSIRNLDDNSAIAIPGVISYDFEDGTWRNSSSEGWQGRQTYQRGELTCAAVGEMDPVVFAIGGATVPATGARDDASQVLDMATIRFWDLDGERWHMQPTTEGRTPAARQSFCAVGAASQNETFEIFVYGGWDKDDNALDDIWILSLPAFRWFKTEAKSTPRFEHRCHRSGDQMISIGGNIFPRWTEKDELERGIGIFNLTSLEWQTNYVADQEYDSPEMVKEWYANGGLDDVEWASDDVKAFFLDSSDSGGSSGVPDGGDETQGDGDDGDEASSGNETPIAAIAGGVVGGVAAFVLAGFLFWFIRRRRRMQREPMPVEVPAGEYPTFGQNGAHMTQQTQYPNAYYPSLPQDQKAMHLSELDSSSPPLELESRQTPVELDSGTPRTLRH